jgi:cytochrome oxidase Cu insertion factor (SCO1/SenC/PrrC family)
MHIEVENNQYLEQQRRGRLMLLCMLIFFVTPIIAVIAMYKMDWRPKGESIGQLVVPAKLLAMDYAFMSSDGSVVQPDLWKDKWSMVYIAGNCQAACKEKLHNIRQLHVSLYKEIPRMQRVLITTSQEVKQLQQDYPDMLILNQPDSEITALSDQFNVNNESSMTADRIYLVDPLGHFMMSYAPATDPALIRKDITRLMRYSWAG